MRRPFGTNDINNFHYQPVPTISPYPWNEVGQSDVEVQRWDSSKAAPTYSCDASKQHCLMILLGMALGFLLGYDRSITVIGNDKGGSRAVNASSVASSSSASIVHATRSDGFHNDMSALERLGELVRAKRVVMQKMFHDYGPYASVLALDQDVFNHLFVVSDESKKRFQRRIMFKIVTQKLMALSNAAADTITTDTNTVAAAATFAQFTWVTGGDTVAGGFGNRPEETYTAVMEETVRPAFAAVGIDFHAHNQAKVGYGSAPELSLCMNSIFTATDDNDVDVLSWDFSRTDGDRSYRAYMWAAQATVHPSNPLLVMMAPMTSPSWSEFAAFDRRGMGVALMDFDALSATQGLLPDSSREGSNPQELPLPLRFYLCNGAPEGSVPCSDAQHNFACPVDGGEECRAQKFTKLDFCHQYGRYQAHWNPGWKGHHFRGRLLGIFWINTLQSALLQLEAMLESQESTNNEEERYQKVLQTIQEQERLDKHLLKNYAPLEFTHYGDVIRDFQLFGTASNRTECFFPSTAIPNPVVPHEGLTGEALLSTTTTVQDENCEVVKLGYREAFAVSGSSNSGEEMTESTLEIHATRPFAPFVRIAVCFQLCHEGGECPVYPYGGFSLEEGRFKIQVNGVDVTSLREFDSCSFLGGATNGFHWEMLSLSSYQLRFQVSKGTLLKVYSVITFH